MQIGRKEVDILSGVIDELPLLLSKEATKKADKKDFIRDKINILGKEMDMKFTTSGHYLIPVSKIYKALDDSDENNTDRILLILQLDKFMTP